MYDSPVRPLTPRASRAVHAHRDLAQIAACAPAPHVQDRLAAAVDEDRVVRIAGRPARPLAVRDVAVNPIGQRVREEQLPGVDDAAAWVPAWIDGSEGCDPARVGLLDAAHERAAGAAGAEAGVVAGCVGMPDVDRGALDRLAGRRVDDGELDDERGSGMSVGDVAPELLVRDVVRTRGQLGSQHAGDGAGLDRSRAAAFGAFGFPSSRAEACRCEAGEPEDRATAEALFVHAAEGIAVA